MNTTFKDVVDEFSGEMTLDEQHHVVDFAMDGVKWYESYPEVKAFERMLREVEELGFSYEFIRIGEESDDIEHKASESSNGYLNTRTEITCYF
jgi:hypothetical protein